MKPQLAPASPSLPIVSPALPQAEGHRANKAAPESIIVNHRFFYLPPNFPNPHPYDLPLPAAPVRAPSAGPNVDFLEVGFHIRSYSGSSVSALYYLEDRRARDYMNAAAAVFLGSDNVQVFLDLCRQSENQRMQAHLIDYDYWFRRAITTGSPPRGVTYVSALAAFQDVLARASGADTMLPPYVLNTVLGYYPNLISGLITKGVPK